MDQLRTVRLIAPCLHIAEYYERKWQGQHCIGYNILRHGYRQWAEGRVRDPETNNLFEVAPA